MRRLILSACFAVGALFGCGSQTFSTALGDAGQGAGGASNGGSSTGGKGASGGGSSNGGSAAGGGGAGFAGSGAGGVTSNGGSSAGGALGSGGVVGAGAPGSGGILGTGGLGAGGVVGNGGAGGSVGNSGDCTLDGTDCHNGARCVEVTPGGYRECAVKFPEASACAGSGQCCRTSDCQGGAICYPQPLAPLCGPVSVGGNVCASDTCTADSSCGANSICAPAGTFQRKVRMCVPAGCHRDVDCTAQAGGICAPVSGGCCDLPIGLYCVYPNGGCRSNNDCNGGSCAVDSKGSAFCSSAPLICPQ